MSTHRHEPEPVPLWGAGLSRRKLLQLGTAAALAAAGSLTLPATPAAAAEDDFDTLRGRWQQLLTGGDFDATAAPYVDVLARLGTQAGQFASTMTPGAAALWPDLPLGHVSNNITQSYVRLKTMALAYAQPGTGVSSDAALASQVAAGLDHLSAHAYTATNATYDNWWDWQIGAPKSLLDACILVYPTLGAEQVAAYCAAIDHFVPDSVVASYSGTSTGANRADLCKVIALRGVVGKNAAKIALASSALSPIFPYVTTGDGLYADGSFIQHTDIPYTGTYGEVMLGDFSWLFALLADSPWAVTDPQAANILDSVTRAYTPFVYNGIALDGVSGRAISRGLQGSNPVAQSDHTRGHALISDILRLAASGTASPAQSAAWKATVKGWITREAPLTSLPYLSDPGVAIPELARAQALLTDSTIPAAAEPIGHRLFAMDRAVHRRPDWAAAVSMCSARTTYYENGNGENLRGWHTSNGMTYWWGTDHNNDQYSDGFWPTVDPYRLPGTTVSTKPLADGEGGAWGAPRPAATWAGGATDGTYASLGQDVRGLSSTLTAKKSWFCLSDSIVCLGAGIEAADGVPIETIVDNRNLGVRGTQPLVVDGRHQPTTPGWRQELRRARSVTIGGAGSYLFPEGATIHALREARTGTWHDINTSSSTQEVTRSYLTLWFDHGTDPEGAHYSYVLLPDTDPDVAQRHRAPRILANTAQVQAVVDVPERVLAANFFSAGSAGPLHVDAPCSILVRARHNTLTIAVSDPTQTGTSVTVTLDATAVRALDADPAIDLTDRHPITLRADVSGAHGASRVVHLATRTPALHGCW
ncbi:polysaccharide lyase 8 family protein [Streptomyces sp. NPDC101225]|uniref:polysaccharide lyase 8 family protein n=1 Tax=Streptomyces sp. NPDC101225 TaxID=3366135 RepID=UPI0038146A19